MFGILIWKGKRKHDIPRHATWIDLLAYGPKTTPLPLSHYIWKSVYSCRLKKYAQLQSWELSFIWGKMRTDCSEKLLERSRGNVSIYGILVKGRIQATVHAVYRRLLLISWRLLLADVTMKDVTMNNYRAFLDTKRCKNWVRKIWKYLSEDLFCQLSQSTECIILDPHPELLLGSIVGRQLLWIMIQSL